MSGLPRPTPAKAILDLTRRLAEDYDDLALPEVGRAVHAAAETVNGVGTEWSGTAEGIPALIDVIEQLAREDLDALAGDRT
jgi:hypothetical protein